MSLVSIIIPVYNAKETINKCLDSIIAQTYEDFEVLLINDGSTDESENICKDYSEKDNRFKLISQKNSGPSAARNCGIDTAAGEYLAFVDSDDYIEPDMIEKMYNAAASTGADITMCGYRTEYDDGTFKDSNIYRFSPGYYDGEEYKKIITDAIDIGLGGNIPPYSCIRLVKSACLENPKLRFDAAIYRSEDYLLWTKVFFKATSLCLITDKILYHYIERKNSITHSYVRNYWIMAKALYMELKSSLPDNEKVKSGLNSMLIQRAYIAMNNATMCVDKKTYKKDFYEVVRDKLLNSVIKSIRIKDADRKYKKFCILMRFKMYGVIRSRYDSKFNSK